MQEFLISVKPDLQSAREDWLKMLAAERRVSALTVEAYERDTRQF
ncbi:MAG: recombinase XerC, partial [Pseudaminobacter sp.]